MLLNKLKEFNIPEVGIKTNQQKVFSTMPFIIAVHSYIHTYGFFHVGLLKLKKRRIKIAKYGGLNKTKKLKK